APGGPQVGSAQQPFLAQLASEQLRRPAPVPPRKATEPGARCTRLRRPAEDTGFEPVRAVNPTRFPIVRLRPLGQSSARKRIRGLVEQGVRVVTWGDGSRGRCRPVTLSGSALRNGRPAGANRAPCRPGRPLSSADGGGTGREVGLCRVRRTFGYTVSGPRAASIL